MRVLLRQIYNSPAEFWSTISTQKKTDKSYQGPDKAKSSESDGGVATWYSSAIKYWDRQEASTNGVLGGFGHVNTADIQDSRHFLMKAFLSHLKQAREGGRRTVAAGKNCFENRAFKMLLRFSA